MGKSRRQKGSVPRDAAAGYIVALGATIQLACSEEDTPYAHAPGQFHPTDTNILEAPVDEEDENVDLEEEAPDAPDSEPEEPAPHEPQGDQNPAPQEPEPEPEPEPEEDLDDEPSTDSDSDDLRTFVTVLGNEPLTAGIKDLALRRGTDGLIGDAPVVNAILDGNYDQAKDLLVSRMQQLRALLVEMDQRLAAESTSQDDENPERAVLQLILQRLDTILTASVQRLPQVLHRIRLDAITIHQQHNTAHDEFDEGRETYIVEHRRVVSSVAEIDRAFRKRQETRMLVRRARAVFERLDRLATDLRSKQQRAAELEGQMMALEGQSMDERERAGQAATSIRRLFRAAAELDVPLPYEVRTQMEEALEPIEQAIHGCEDCFIALDPIDIDPTLEDALSTVSAHEARLEHILNPIRASVFRERLDRDEELKRLTLLAFRLLTAKGARGGGVHDGFGRKSVANSILPLSNYVDSSESARIYDLVGELKVAGLLETNQVGRSWRYRPTAEGIRKAKVWLAECLNPGIINTQIDIARKSHNANQRKQRAQRRSS